MRRLKKVDLPAPLGPIIPSDLSFLEPVVHAVNRGEVAKTLSNSVTFEKDLFWHQGFPCSMLATACHVERGQDRTTEGTLPDLGVRLDINGP